MTRKVAVYVPPADDGVSDMLDADRMDVLEKPVEPIVLATGIADSCSRCPVKRLAACDSNGFTLRMYRTTRSGVYFCVYKL